VNWLDAVSPGRNLTSPAVILVGRRRFLQATLLALAAGAHFACGARPAAPRPQIAPADVPGSLARGSTSTPFATVLPMPFSASSATASATATEPPTPSEGPAEQVDGIALGGGTPIRSLPTMVAGETVATLADRQPVVILREVRGERFVVGEQTWAMAIQDWTNLWYRVAQGYVYSGFVFIPRSGEMETLSDRSAPRSVDIDLVRQRASAMAGDKAVHVAAATTGKPGFATPAGLHVIPPWGRKLSETMTSAQAAIQDPAEQYNVQNVLYTQYFDDQGDALHLNYWQPESVFGTTATSHGCVGLGLHDAQYFWLFAGPGMSVTVHPAPATATATPSPADAASTAPARVLVPPLTPTALRRAASPTAASGAGTRGQP
jgi:hypothetical protein